MNNIFFYETDIGKIGIAENGKAITNVYFNNGQILEEFNIEETDLLRKAGKELKEYFDGERTEFDIPIEVDGTDFRKSVWKELCNIPYGETCTYGDIAKRIGNPKASRAVGLANNKNRIPIFIPCHRVIGANGKLVGFAGGIEIKKYLLDLESKRIVKSK